MSTFVRDNEVKEVSDAVKLFQMAEFCEVFLAARRIKNDDTEFIPMIQRGKLDKMPAETAEEMDAMFKMAVRELEKCSGDPRAFFEKLEKGEYDPVSDFIDTDIMKDALGFVIMRRLRVNRGIVDEEEQYTEAKKIFNSVRDSMHRMVSETMIHAMSNLAEEVVKKELKFDDLSKHIEVKLSMVNDQGFAFSAEIKPSAFEAVEKSKKDKKKEVEYDPAWG